MDLVCRKLWLRPGEKVVDAGCGWGALSIYMARHYGVHVKAFNISREQIEFARDRAKREALTSRVEFIRTIIATSPDALMHLSQSECWSTSGVKTTARWVM